MGSEYKLENSITEGRGALIFQLWGRGVAVKLNYGGQGSHNCHRLIIFNARAHIVSIS